jgi:hypothetical protein
MSPRVCGQKYHSKSTGENLACTNPIGHTVTELSDHSWEWLRRAEEDPPEAGGIPEIEDLIEGIAGGEYDPYIESLLAALHGRKRAMRSVPHPYGRAE